MHLFHRLDIAELDDTLGGCKLTHRLPRLGAARIGQNLYRLQVLCLYHRIYLRARLVRRQFLKCRNRSFS